MRFQICPRTKLRNWRKRGLQLTLTSFKLCWPRITRMRRKLQKRRRIRVRFILKGQATLFFHKKATLPRNQKKTLCLRLVVRKQRRSNHPQSYLGPLLIKLICSKGIGMSQVSLSLSPGNLLWLRSRWCKISRRLDKSIILKRNRYDTQHPSTSRTLKSGRKRGSK